MPTCNWHAECCAERVLASLARSVAAAPRCICHVLAFVHARCSPPCPPPTALLRRARGASPGLRALLRWLVRASIFLGAPSFYERLTPQAPLRELACSLLAVGAPFFQPFPTAHAAC